MMNLNKNVLFMLILMLGISVLSFAKTTEISHIKNITAITEVFGEGQKLTAVAIEYDKKIKNTSLKIDSFNISERTITRIYTNNELSKTKTPKNGNYVIIELSPNDSKALLHITGPGFFKDLPAEISLIQTRDIKTIWGKTYKANSEVISNNQVKNLIVDDFSSFEFNDSQTGITVKYNLYIPKDYNPKKSYPLVFFGHDGSAISKEVKSTLRQGNGAIVWATPEQQAKHECFVLAPQYSVNTADDMNGEYKTTADLDATVNLIKDLETKYNIDNKRIYATGQSMGAMSTIIMNIKYPDLFAALYLVAGQWDVSKMDALSHKNIWIVVSQGDIKAYPGMNAATTLFEKNGAKVTRDVWSGTGTSEEIKNGAEKMISEDSNIKYVSLKKGSVVLPGQDDNPGLNHINTWRIAYGFEPIMDWLFTQVKK